MTVAQLTEKRAKLISDARAIYDAAKAENRAPTAEERSRFDALMAESDTIQADLDRLSKLEAEERALSETRGRRTSSIVQPTDELRDWLLNENGTKAFRASFRNDPLRSIADRSSWEQRALSTGTPSAGGYTVPEGFVNAVEVALLTHDAMRSVATVIRTASGNPLPWPTVDDTSNEGVLLAENAEASEKDISFGVKTLNAYKISSGIVRVSRELLQDAGVNVPELVGRLLGERIGRALNKYHTVGTGDEQFEGVLTGATASGVVTETLGEVSYSELVRLQHSVDAAYRNTGGAVFMFNDKTLAFIKTLTDENGRPLWVSGMASGEPATILGHRYIINPHLPDLDEAGEPSILFGQMSKFIIRDVSEIVIARADERYFEYDQVAFHGLYRGDSLLLDAGTHPVKYLTNGE